MTTTKAVIRTIARNVKRLREEQELTQEQLAVRADLSRFVIQSLENGRTSPRAKTLRDVAAALGTTPAALRGEETPPLVDPTADRAEKLRRLRELRAEQRRLERELGETGTS